MGGLILIMTYSTIYTIQYNDKVNQPLYKVHILSKLVCLYYCIFAQDNPGLAALFVNCRLTKQSPVGQTISHTQGSFALFFDNFKTNMLPPLFYAVHVGSA